MILRIAISLLASVLGVCFSISAIAQNASSACGTPPIDTEHAQPNIFNEQQEEWLGDAMADMVEHAYRPVSDPAQSAYLQAIVNRLVATLPPTKLKFHVVLVDSSEINGFSLAGGRIYMTRKMAAAANNDDELAAVLGHEMGHIASHQFVYETTRDLKRLLGVTSVGDRADVYAKFQALMDARIRDKNPGKGGDSDEDQGVADKVGVYVTASAGNRPQAGADFWNRVFFVGGRTGGKMSDLFGFTKPDEKRLRGMLAMASVLPKGCGGTKSEVTTAFTEWHRSVVANQAVAVSTTEAMKEVSLSPALRMDLDRLHFSRDGKTILAQDEGSIFVLSREPLAVLFRMDATNALPAEFSPDSTKVVFSTPGLHTEEWSIVDKKLMVAQEVVTRNECLQSKMSPDGRTLVCITLDLDNFQVNLSLVDVASGTVLWEKKPFFEPSFFGALELLYLHSDDIAAEVLPARFSADGNYLLLGPRGSKLAIDLRTRTPVMIGGGLRDSVTGDYAFLGNDKVAVVNTFDPKSSGIFSFPDGRQLQKVKMPFARLGSVSGMDPMVLAYGVPDYGVVLADLSDGKFIGLKTRAADAWNGTMIGETSDGTVAMMKIGVTDPAQEKRITLPLSPLATPQSVSISDDGKYLALSTRYRGGIWDLRTGRETMLMYGFTGAQWGANDTLFVDVPKRDKTERHIAQVTTAPAALTSLSYTVDDKTHMRYGFLMEWKPNGKKEMDLVMHNPADDATLWNKVFTDGPSDLHRKHWRARPDLQLPDEVGCGKGPCEGECDVGGRSGCVEGQGPGPAD